MDAARRILDHFRLDGKQAVVTGASRGIGKAIALGLAAAGADIALIGRDVGTLAPVAREIAEDLGRQALPVPLDLSDLDAQPAAMERVLAAFGQIDILVNNAGMNIRVESADFSAAQWDEVLNTNLRGTFFLTQACGKEMIRRRQGKILNIVSMTSFLGVPTTVAYTASKAALQQMTKLLAVEWAEFNIQVNAIAPGWIRTEMTESVKGTPREQWILNRTPAGRFGQPDELAGAAVFLCSAAADFITGQTIAVDGGILAGSDWRTGR